jgi:cytochrome c biogenesis protein
MSTPARTVPASSFKPGGLDPLRWLWNLLTNVKFALVLVGTAAAAGFVGVVVPQMPGPMRGNPAARSAWLELQREDFGPFTGLMETAGLFEVFHSTWFNGLWVLIIVAVTVCTVSRFRPTWRSVQSPQKTVPDSYFERAHHRAAFSHSGGAEALEAALKRRHYSVERTRSDGGSTYLFAERFGWSHYGTFVSHLALLMLLVGGLLTQFVGFGRTLALAESMPGAPVFSDPGSRQMFVTMLDSVRRIDDDGNIIDYRSHLEVTRGDESVQCTATVNDPCHAFGYRFHQAAFFDDVGRLRIEASDGRVIYDDVVDFEEQRTFNPRIRIEDGEGNVIHDAALPQSATFPGATDSRDDDAGVGPLMLPLTPGEPANPLMQYLFAWQIVDGAMRVGFGPPDAPARELPEGEPVEAAGHTVTFLGPEAVPAIQFADMPGAITEDGSVTVQMLHDSAGEAYLYVVGIDLDDQVLPAGEPVQTESFRYTFRGQLEGAGIDIRRDPGDTFIWLAVGMAIIGLAITFYVPRRRLWLKVTGERTQVAGIAEKTTRLDRELRLMGAELGSPDALRPGDLERDW